VFSLRSEKGPVIFGKRIFGIPLKAAHPYWLQADKRLTNRLGRNAKKTLTLFLGFGALHPRPRYVGIPPVGIGPEKVSEKTSGKKVRIKNRGQGDVPLGLPPPPGKREGYPPDRWGI